MFHDKNCQDQSKSVIHLLSLKEHFFTESHAVIHSISKHSLHTRCWAWIGRDTKSQNQGHQPWWFPSKSPDPSEIFYLWSFSMSVKLNQHKSCNICLQGGTVPLPQLCKFSERYAQVADAFHHYMQCPGVQLASFQFLERGMLPGLPLSLRVASPAPSL